MFGRVLFVLMDMESINNIPYSLIHTSVMYEVCHNSNCLQMIGYLWHKADANQETWQCRAFPMVVAQSPQIFTSFHVVFRLFTSHC